MKKIFLIIILFALSLSALWYYPSRWVSPIGNEIQIYKQGTAKKHAHGHWEISVDKYSDSYFYIGYLMAHDRLFQMEMARRLVKGELSEIIGKATLNIDLYQRNIRSYKLIKEYLKPGSYFWSHENKEVRKEVESFIHGINTYVNQIKNKPWFWPPEFRILGFRPAPFSIEDSLSGLYSMDDFFNQNFSSDLFLTKLILDHKPSIFKSINSPVPELSTSLKKLYANQQNKKLKKNQKSKTTKGEDAQKEWGILRPYQKNYDYRGIMNYINANASWKTASASNAFVCNGNRSKTSYPILANDPHLNYQAPPFFYQIDIKTKKDRYRHFFMPLTPYPAIGYSNKSAFGVTVSGIDQHDYFLIESGKEDPSKYYLWDEKPRKFKVEKDQIKIKGEKPFDFEIRQTHFGTLLEHPRFPAGSFRVAVKAMISEPGNHVFTAMREAIYAETASEIEKHLNLVKSPSSNLIWAGKNGDIAYFLVGYAAERNWDSKEVIDYWISKSKYKSAWTEAKKQNLSPFKMKGSWILPPYEKFLWKESFPASKNAKIINPEIGCIGSANDAFSKDFEKFPELASHHYNSGFRAIRIKELLNQSKKHSLESFKKIQLDIYDKFAEIMLKKLVKVFSLYEIEKSLNEEGLKHWNSIKQWDFMAKKEKTEPFKFYLLLNLISIDFFKSNFDSLELEILSRWKNNQHTEFLLSLMQYLIEKKNPDLPIKQKENGGELASKLTSKIAETLNNFDNESTKLFGKATDKLNWGDVHKIKISNPMQSIPFLGKFFNPGSFPVDGSGDTINLQSIAGQSYSNDFKSDRGAAIRLIAPLSNPEKAEYIIFPGNSGVPGDENFSSGMDDFFKSNYKK